MRYDDWLPSYRLEQFPTSGVSGIVSTCCQYPAMLISQKLAGSAFADLTRNSAVDVDPNALIVADFRRHGHCVIGDIALRGYKHRGRWTYDERDIRRAGATLAKLHIDAEDLVAVNLPHQKKAALDERDPEVWDQADWRRVLWSWMDHAAFLKAHRAGHDSDMWASRREIGANGLPGQLSMEEFLEFSQHRTLGGTWPLRWLAWSGKEWQLPRAYVALLNRWEQLEEDLIDRARECSVCGVRGPRREWRTSTMKGYVTLCPSCSGTTFQEYRGQFRGKQYGSLRRTCRADDYLCRVCGQSRAFAWDHCHEHGYVRGPVCASCNTFEAMGLGFLWREGGARHLLECTGCLGERTLPRRFRIDVVRKHLKHTDRHSRCESAERELLSVL